MSEPQEILNGLGGAVNIDKLESCITRLRVEVKDPAQVDEATLKDAGAYGVVLVGNTVQVVVGPQADELALQINTLERA